MYVYICIILLKRHSLTRVKLTALEREYCDRELKLKLRKKDRTSVGKWGDSNGRTISGYSSFIGSIDFELKGF